MKIGDKVKKVQGYEFTGVVVSVFETLTNKTRLVVEIEGPGNCSGMLLIFSPEQMEVIN